MIPAEHRDAAEQALTEAHDDPTAVHRALVHAVLAHLPEETP